MNTQPKIELFKKLNTFVKRFYTNQLIKGGIYCLAVLTIFFIIFSIAPTFDIEHILDKSFIRPSEISIQDDAKFDMCLLLTNCASPLSPHF